MTHKEQGLFFYETRAPYDRTSGAQFRNLGLGIEARRSRRSHPDRNRSQFPLFSMFPASLVHYPGGFAGNNSFFYFRSLYLPP